MSGIENFGLRKTGKRQRRLSEKEASTRSTMISSAMSSLLCEEGQMAKVKANAESK